MGFTCSELSRDGQPVHDISAAGTRRTPAKLRPLGQEARELARRNAGTVARFLAHYRLSDDWYDVVVFRYLLAVQNWLDRPELHRYAFSTIAWRAMSSAVSNERRKRLRRGQAVSLDAPLPGMDGLTLGDTVASGDPGPYRTRKNHGTYM